MTVRDQNEYEDLLAEWSNLESGLGVLLSYPVHAQEFRFRIIQYDRWMQNLLLRNSDVALYMLFQLAGNSPVGYSAAHALVCSVLCQLLTQELGIGPAERGSLVHAALTMNVGMTHLQDVLATQVERPSPRQQEQIQQHPSKGVQMLRTLGVQDETWLSIVANHHEFSAGEVPFETAPSAVRLARIIRLVDRYAAMISPRLSRAGRTATESVRSVMASASPQTDPLGHALLRCVGLCPPGTFVRLESRELGIVVRRGEVANQPYIAIVGSAEGELLDEPRLHDPATGPLQIESALSAASVRAQLNHARVLRLAS